MNKLITSVFILFIFSIKAQVFNGPAGNILNNGQNTYFNLTVSGLPSLIDSIFGLKEVCLNISHPKVEELHIYLKSPAGNIVELTEGTSCQGPNYLNTCFNNTVNTSITLGTAPYSGSYKPIGYLGRFNTGQTANGVWTLIVKDYLAFVDSGNVVSWNLKFGNSPPHPVVFNSSNLPIVVINSNNQLITGSKILVNMGIIDNGPVRNYLTDPYNNYNAKAMIHNRGNSTKNFEKKSYSFETRNPSGIKLTASILGMPLESDWELIAPYQDKSLLRIPLSYDLFRQMGHYASRYKNVEVLLNNEYQGIYTLLEKPKRDSNRINISKLTTLDNSGINVTGGYILKIDRSDAAGWFSLLPGNPPGVKHFYYQYVYPQDSVITTPQKNYIKNVLDSFETAMNSPTFANPTVGYSKYINVNSFIDFFIINELSKNVDAYKLSTFLYKDKITKGGKIHIGPVWDYDIAWHNCNYNNSFNATGWEYQAPDSTNPVPTWWNRLMQDSNFVNKLYCRWHQLRSGILSINHLNNYIDSSTNVLNESRIRNFKQWPVIGAFIYPNPQNQISSSYLAEVNDLKFWLANRIAWMDGAISGSCTVTGIKENTLNNNDNLFVYPNPFSTSVTFAMNLSQGANVSLKIVDATGKEVGVLISEYRPAGESKIVYDRKQSQAGIYFYQLKINDTVKTGKIILQ